MTTISVPASAAATRVPLGRHYGRLWRLVPRQIGYLIPTGVVAVVAVAAVGQLGPNDVTALVLLVALAILIGVLTGRPLGALERLRLRGASTPPVAEPVRTRTRPGPLGAIGDAVADPHAWLSVVHTVVFPLLGIATSAVWGLWTLGAVGMTTFPLWGLLIPLPVNAPRGFAGTMVDGQRLPINGDSLETLLYWAFTGRVDQQATLWWTIAIAAIGLGLAALLPFVLRGAVFAHWGLARLLLARFASDELRERAEAATSAQRAAIAAEDHALRRLERDIHDGPQQRLLRLQMELALAERRLDDDPGTAADAVGAARVLAAETLDELRALAQGFAPPLLQDRGLTAALEALGRRSAIPIDVSIRLDAQVPEAVQRSIYFVAAELTSNAIKHAECRRITLVAVAEQDAEGRRLRLEVTDDGLGGAQTEPGHGLAGVQERLAGLGGSLTLVSPEGGPTRATVLLPLA